MLYIIFSSDDPWPSSQADGVRLNSANDKPAVLAQLRINIGANRLSFFQPEIILQPSQCVWLMHASAHERDCEKLILDEQVEGVSRRSGRLLHHHLLHPVRSMFRNWKMSNASINTDQSKKKSSMKTRITHMQPIFG